ncbi:MAG TPA: penicillin acylase family protein [Burkholderiales bacterium]|nr:penicillin acylase family protein [Burkholderiales bacterium]
MKWFLRLAVGFVALLALGAGGGFLYLRQSLPQVEGQITLAGIGAAIDIQRDRYGIPHIYAGSLEDAVFGLGYVHAQDRLWQMEMNRRIAAGRMAEVLGPAALETDRFLRTLGVRRAAEANLAHVDPETRKMLEAYAAGVNAFLASEPVLPLEFWLTGARPQAWSPVDSAGWIKMMAWDLGGNWRSELLRMRLSKTLPLERIHQFVSPYPGEAPPKIADLKSLYAPLERQGVQLAAIADELLALAPGDAPDALGSNNWVTSGANNESGKPLLANDPHLGLTAPPVWYFAHLSAPGMNVIGATLPGVPAIVLGRNDRIAWGFTNTGPDVQDLFIEKLDDAGNYLTPEGPRAFTRIEETIKVRGAQDERLQIRVSRHGPVISDVSRAAQAETPRGYVLAFSWTALAEDDRTLVAAHKIARAGNWQEFLAAARDFHTPQQNMVYADVDGNIGFIAAGRVPLRKPDNDLKGLAPAPGWEARYDWAGWIPFEQLPQSYNPPSGRLWTANEKITPAGYAHEVSNEWQPPYRANRIAEMLQATPRHSVATFASMQGDVLSAPIRESLPRLLQTRPKSAQAQQALDWLRKWDGTMSAGRPEPMIAWAWWREFTRALYSDELGEAFRTQWSPRAVFVANVLARSGDHERWCDDVRTPALETCDELLASSLEASLAELRRRYGEDPSGWRWGDAHYARHEHRPFGRQPLLARWFDIRVASPGDAYTVNVGRHDFFDEERPFANRHAASLRAIYDLAQPQKSLFIHSGGQSGNVLSSHYRAFAEAWSRGEYVPMLSERSMLDAQPHSLLRLVPGR